MRNIFIDFLPPWVETGLQPAFYDKESGTVLQQTARMYAKINELIAGYNSFTENITNQQNDFEQRIDDTVDEYIEKFTALKDFVDNYFDNLDVQEEINNKLDAMSEAGTLADIISQYLNSIAIFGYDNVASMKASTNLIDGSYARTLGFHALNDGGGALYKIRTITNADVVDDATIISIGDDDLIAELIILSEVHTKQIGCYGDNTHDDTANLQKAINIAESTVGVVFVDHGIYKITDDLIINKSIKIYGEYERGETSDNLVYGSEIKQYTLNENVFTYKENISFYAPEISHLRLAGNGGIGIATRDADVFSEFTFEYLHFNGSFSIAMDVAGSIGRISNCDFAANEIGIKLTAQSIWIYNNNFWNNSLCDIKFDGISRDSIIRDCWFEKTVTTGSSLLFEAPSNIFKFEISGCSFKTSTVPAVLFNGISNITAIMRFVDVIFSNCRFVTNSSHAVKVRMINDNAQQNTNGSNSSQIIWKHCEFDNVNSYAIETDYATLYWTMETCYAYSNFGYGSATIKDPNFTSLICSIMIKNKITTDSSIEFNAITNSGFGNGKNRLYLDSSNILSFNDNNNNKRNFHYIRFGVTSNRPVGALTGTMYLDTTLSKPVWWTGSKWVFADGTNA